MNTQVSNTRPGLVKAAQSKHPRAWLCGVLVLCLTATGCNRAFYRHRADREVYNLVDCAAEETSGELDGFTIEPNPDSRFFDPNCPDLPPMPPDDPLSHQLMHCVDCKHGWPCWHCYGQTSEVESPRWKSNMPTDENGVLVLDRRAAVSVALVNSPAYQRELEDLYLSALDVTFQRFQFDTKFFGGNSTFFTTDGPSRGSGQLSRLKTDTSLQMTKLLAGGGELVAGVANSLVWQFAGADDYSATTLLDFSLVQPLLRGAGRAVVMEGLTDSERALLANVRQMERFRRGFYTAIVNGRGSGTALSRGGISLASLSVGGGATGGILGLMAEQVRIRNQRTNVTQLRSNLQQFDALYRSDRVDRLQVDQVRQQLYDSQGRMLSITTAYDTRLDSYKISLGLPPNQDIRIDDPLLRQFDFIDPRILKAQNELTDLMAVLADPESEPDMDTCRQTTLASITACEEMLEVSRADVDKLVEVLPARREGLRKLLQREEFNAGKIERSVSDVAALNRRASDLQGELVLVEERVGSTLDKLATLLEDETAPTRQQLYALLDEMASELGDLLLIQATARVDTVMLVSVNMTSQSAYRTAKENRRDWKNARAGLVDIWRQIEIAANDLRSGVDVTFSGDLGTTGNNPARFRGTTGRLRVGLEFDAPLTRLAERNAYRETLINYQQARRDYYTFEDEVSSDLREIIRKIRLNQLNFQLSRAAVHVAISQVEITQLRLREPPKPGATSKFGATTARDLVSALSRLLSAQNELLGVWVNYEVERLSLDLQLGTMQLDEQGQWIDPGPIVPTESDDSEDTVSGDTVSGDTVSGDTAAESEFFEEISQPEGIFMPELLPQQ